MSDKLAIYVRVSTSEQTVENQKLTLIELCQKSGYEYDIYEEVMSTKKIRPTKELLMGKLLNHEYSGILVYKLDRFARSFPELINDVEKLLKEKIDFISYSDNLNFSTASGKLHFHILSAFADFERSMISERTKEGLKRVRATGKHIGRPMGRKDSVKRSNARYLGNKNASL